MKTIFQTKNAPCGLISVLPFLAALFATAVTPASAQIYVETAAPTGIVGEYDATTGAPINPNLISLPSPSGASLALSGNNLFVSQITTPYVGEWEATTGAAINSGFVTGLAMVGTKSLALSGSSFFVSSHNPETIGQYDPTTGAALNPNFITLSGSGTRAIALLGNNLFIYNGTSIGQYSVTTGAALNPSFITGLNGALFVSGTGLALSGNNLYVAENSGSSGIVGEYNATTGAPINANFITGLGNQLTAIAISGSDLLVENGTTIGEYDATTGAPINASFITGLPGTAYGLAVVAAPEPSALALMSASGLVFVHWRRRRSTAH